MKMYIITFIYLYYGLTLESARYVFNMVFYLLYMLGYSFNRSQRRGFGQTPPYKDAKKVFGIDICNHLALTVPLGRFKLSLRLLNSFANPVFSGGLTRVNTAII